MAISDWSFRAPNQRCNFRVAGVLLRGDRILVQRERDGNEYALPGGHVIFGETSEQSLIREFKEETGADISVNRIAWIEECFWRDNCRGEVHTLVFYYPVALEGASSISDDYFAAHLDNNNVVVEWKSISELRDVVFYPGHILAQLPDIPTRTEHFITVE